MEDLDELAEFEDLRDLMESNGGINHGRRKNRSGKWVPLEAADFDWHVRKDIHEEVPIAARPDVARFSIKRNRHFRHGTGTGYQNYGCKCDECKAWWANYMRERRRVQRGL